MVVANYWNLNLAVVPFGIVKLTALETKVLYHLKPILSQFILIYYEKEYELLF